ncbi:transposase [Burkholderia pseudomallei]|nr:transposase [Burkholderia pseudomallei]
MPAATASLNRSRSLKPLRPFVASGTAAVQAGRHAGRSWLRSRQIVSHCTLPASPHRARAVVNRIKTRGGIERSFAWLHNFRRLPIRFERLAAVHEALMEIPACIICWRQLRKTIVLELRRAP